MGWEIFSQHTTQLEKWLVITCAQFRWCAVEVRGSSVPMSIGGNVVEHSHPRYLNYRPVIPFTPHTYTLHGLVPKPTDCQSESLLSSDWVWNIASRNCPLGSFQ